MALKIVTGGTTGAADGTLVSSGNKLTLTALSPSHISAHIRCDDGYWSNDQAFTIPSNIQISFDGGSTWKGSGDSPYTAPEIEDVNFPIRIRQVASASGDVTLVTDGTYTAITALATVSGLTATPGNAQVDLSWSAVANRTYYQIQRATDSGFTANLTTLTSTATATTYTDTGRTNGTTYYYRVKAIGTGRYSDSAAWASTSATPSNAWTDDFSTLDTTSTWLAITSGSGTVAASGGKAVITKNATGNKALLVAKAQPITHGTTKTVTAKVDMSGIGASDDQHPVLALARKSSAPTSGDTFTDAYFPLRIELYRLSTDGHLYYRFKYQNTSPAGVWYDFGGGGAWSTTFDGATDGTGSWKILPSGDTAQYTYVIEMDATNGVRFLVKSADGATTHATSAWVAWSAINGSGDYYVAFGAWQYSFTSAFTGTMNVDSVTIA